MRPRQARVTFAVILCGYLMVAAPASAAANDVQCGLVEDDLVAIDGMLDDWQGVKGARVGGSSKDASYTVRCAYDRSRLYVVVDVREDPTRGGRLLQPRSSRDSCERKG